MAKFSLWKTANWLMLIGALNWGAVSLGFNLVEMIPFVSDFAKIVYGLVGASAVYILLKRQNIIK